jgi:hypothetical protein
MNFARTVIFAPDQIAPAVAGWCCRLFGQLLAHLFPSISEAYAAVPVVAAACLKPRTDDGLHGIIQ